MFDSNNIYDMINYQMYHWQQYATNNSRIVLLWAASAMLWPLATMVAKAVSACGIGLHKNFNLHTAIMAP